MIIQRKTRIIALMKGAGFSEIGNTVVSTFKPFGGVLKIRELPVVTLFET